MRWRTALALGYWAIAASAALAQEHTPAAEPDKPEALDNAALTQRLAELEAELARQRKLLEVSQSAPPPDEAEPDAAAVADLIAEAKEETSTVAEEPMLRLYGFADVGLQRLWTDDVVTEISPETDKLTFVLGNVNLYLDANPSRDFRFLSEIRFGLFPSGSASREKGSFVFGAPLDTNVSDPSAANAFFTSVRWAGVMLERAHIDWTPSDTFNLRAGLFLTPYGIWNVDHGTPTRIMVSEPLFLSSQLIPSQLIGVEAFGTFQFLPWTLGYHLHVSNGRTNGQVDFSDSKAIGGRLYLSTRNPFPFKVGLSGYMGDNEDVEDTLGLTKVNYALDEYAVSGDLSIDVGSLRLRSEVVFSWHVYEDGKRRVWAGQQLADVMRMGAYLVLAYQLPWAGLEPLVMAEIIRVPVPRYVPVGEGLIMPSVGLNVYFTPTTMLRSQFSIAHGFDFSDNPVDPEGFLYQAVARLITAF
ncbi:MAG TPA: hypothetical protein VJR89_19475 [Polyangiales bacterium]|nr:hypothetical protein [Polyangiales bacterium]